MASKLKTVIGLILIALTYYLESLIPHGEYTQAMGALALMALAQAGKSVYDYYQNKKNAPSAYANTAQGKRLAELQKSGAYSGAARNEIIGATNRVATGSAETNRANYMGRIANMGQGGSIAAQRGLNEIEGNRGQIVANEAGRVTALNEQSKIQAADQYAAGADARADQIRQYNANTNKELVGGLAGAATGYLSGKMAESASQTQFERNMKLNLTPEERMMAQIQSGGEGQQPSAPANGSSISAIPNGGYQTQQSPYSPLQQVGNPQDQVLQVFGGSTDAYNQWYATLPEPKPRNWEEALIALQRG